MLRKIVFWVVALLLLAAVVLVRPRAPLELLMGMASASFVLLLMIHPNKASGLKSFRPLLWVALLWTIGLGLTEYTLIAMVMNMEVQNSNMGADQPNPLLPCWPDYFVPPVVVLAGLLLPMAWTWWRSRTPSAMEEPAVQG